MYLEAPSPCAVASPRSRRSGNRHATISRDDDVVRQRDHRREAQAPAEWPASTLEGDHGEEPADHKVPRAQRANERKRTLIVEHDPVQGRRPAWRRQCPETDRDEGDDDHRRQGPSEHRPPRSQSAEARARRPGESHFRRPRARSACKQSHGSPAEGRGWGGCRVATRREGRAEVGRSGCARRSATVRPSQQEALDSRTVAHGRGRSQQGETGMAFKTLSFGP